MLIKIKSNYILFERKVDQSESEDSIRDEALHAKELIILRLLSHLFPRVNKSL